jgi:hypothetical protein
MHINFENRCKAVQSLCVADFRKENFKYYLRNTKKIIGKACAYMSADLFFTFQKKILPKDTVAKWSVCNAQRAVVGMLGRFYKDALL